MVITNCLWLGHATKDATNIRLGGYKKLFKYEIKNFFSHLNLYDDYELHRSGDELKLKLQIDNADITLNIFDVLPQNTNANVCLITFPITNNRCVNQIKQWASDFKKIFPGSPILLAGFATEANYKTALYRRAIIAGNEEVTKEEANRVARDIEAVKYVECSNVTGRGAKILVDEVAYAALGRIMDKEEHHDQSKCDIQ